MVKLSPSFLMGVCGELQVYSLPFLGKFPARH